MGTAIAAATLLAVAIVEPSVPPRHAPRSEATWVHGRALTENGEALLALLEAARQEGLDPEDYGTSELVDLAEGLEHGAIDPDAVEAAAWVALFAYVDDRANGRVRASEVQRTWRQTERDATDFVRKMVADGHFPEGLGALDPPYVAFDRLRDAAADVDTWEPWPSVPDGPTLRPDDTAPLDRLSALTSRLAAEDPSAAGIFVDVRKDGTAIYGGPLVDAVARFQARRGLSTDGVVGRATMLALRATPADLADTVSANLDRWRWMPRDVPDREIRVNVPAYTLELLEHDTSIETLRVIVGQPHWPTPPFLDALGSVVLNPDWHVPTSIVTAEIGPSAERDPSVLEPYDVVVDGEPVDPTSVDWSHPGNVRLHQAAGEDNPLGRVKVQLGNDLGIYLHDTSSPELFAHMPRDLSHGCIRVEAPLTLVSFVTGRSEEELGDRIAEGRTVSLSPAEPVAVTIGYWTAWVDETGALRFAPDVYGYDARMARAR